MSEDVSTAWIRTWCASYYEPRAKKWLDGQLKLGSSSLQFVANKTEENSSPNRLKFNLYFSNIMMINKAMSSMIFPSIVAQTTGNENHWFSSFYDRNSSFVIINHFFEASLLTTNSGGRQSNEHTSSKLFSKKTQLGTALLNSVHDSDVTLGKAASSLINQREQLAAISCTMQDIQEDLTVAERVTAGLNSWLGRWRKTETVTSGALILIKTNDIPDVLDVEVLYTKVLSSKVGPQTCGVCRVESNGITILDMKQKTIHHFNWSEISRVRAVSPWEMMITQYLIGQPDLSFTIVSVHALSLLSKITCYVASKVEYIEPPSNNATRKGGSKMNKNPEHLSCQKLNEPNSNISQEECIGHNSQVSASKLKEAVISDEEVDELTATLESIKSTALGIKIEQESQLQDIDEITNSVIKANDTVRTMNRTMDKLMK